MYILGIFSQWLENQGMTVAIGKKTDEQGYINAKTTLQYLVNGMSDKIK